MAEHTALENLRFNAQAAFYTEHWNAASSLSKAKQGGKHSLRHLEAAKERGRAQLGDQVRQRNQMAVGDENMEAERGSSSYGTGGGGGDIPIPEVTVPDEDDQEPAGKRQRLEVLDILRRMGPALDVYWIAAGGVRSQELADAVDRLGELVVCAADG